MWLGECEEIIHVEFDKLAVIGTALALLLIPAGVRHIHLKCLTHRHNKRNGKMSRPIYVSTVEMDIARFSCA